jgi:hypothetical protein
VRGWWWLRRNSRLGLWWLRRNSHIVLRWLRRIVVVALLIGLTHEWDAIWSRSREIWSWYQGTKTPSEAFAPIFTLAAGLLIAGVTLMRHFAQTEADRQRRITESYSKAVEQLSSDKIEQRLGGIYTLERISQESRKDYWTIMETLTAFVRERARWREPDAGASETQAWFYEGDKANPGKEPPTDIAA